MSQRQRPKRNESQPSGSGRNRTQDVMEGLPVDVVTPQQKSASQREWDGMDSAERKQIIKHLTRYLLFAGSQKTPLKRDELVKSVLGGHGKVLNIALKTVNTTLERVFGVKAIEKKKGSQTIYVLINCLPLDTKDTLMIRSDEDLAQFGLLGTILSYLLMRPQGTATNDQIWMLLNHLNLTEENTHHPVFGKVKEILDPFIEQGYLEHEKKVVGDQAVIEYRWGPRARVEIDKKEMLIVLAEIHGDNFDLWERQFRDLIKD